MVERVRRRQDDRGAARQAHPSLPHCGNRQPVIPLSAQQHGGQGQDQGMGAEVQDLRYNINDHESGGE